jgi:NAD(P)-dependent dehydrogenase (short-subunit alcohol dehydrogenase family)
VDVLVNAAGGYTLGKVTHELSVADWDMVMDSNLKGSFLCAKFVLPHMSKAGGGRIINFASNAARTSSPALGVLAKEYAPHQILVNTVAPGPADVERNTEILGPEAREQLRREIPLGPLRGARRHLRRGAVPGRRGCAPHHRRDDRRQRRLRDGVRRCGLQTSLDAARKVINHTFS